MHKGDYHTDYSKYYDKEYKDRDLAFDHIKELKNELRKKNEAMDTNKNLSITYIENHEVKRKIYHKGKSDE